MATGNSAPAAPSAHPNAQWHAARDISTLVAGNDTGLSPRFVVVSIKWAKRRYLLMDTLLNPAKQEVAT
jgi:hypothetical protein